MCAALRDAGRHVGQRGCDAFPPTAAAETKKTVFVGVVCERRPLPPLSILSLSLSPIGAGAVHADVVDRRVTCGGGGKGERERDSKTKKGGLKQKRARR